jgi:hypothetical protein
MVTVNNLMGRLSNYILVIYINMINRGDLFDFDIFGWGIYYWIIDKVKSTNGNHNFIIDCSELNMTKEFSFSNKMN